MINTHISKYALLILAAGNSSRLGRPKQLVKIEDQYLIKKTIDAASRLHGVDVQIVLGAYAEEILQHINIPYPVHINPDWEKGMGSSISFGASKIIDHTYEAVILSVCDQPYLETKHFQQLIDKYESDSDTEIIISEYKTGNGPPSLFSNKYFEELYDLIGEEGAKEIVKTNISKTLMIPFDQGHIDIDDEDDIRAL